VFCDGHDRGLTHLLANDNQCSLSTSTTPLTLYCGDLREVLPTLLEASVDFVVTDPPYGLSFMEKDWDHDFRAEVLAAIVRVCKPGALLLAFGGTRTYHRLICAIEDAGWEIRDCLMWLYVRVSRRRPTWAR